LLWSDGAIEPDGEGIVKRRVTVGGQGRQRLSSPANGPPIWNPNATYERFVELGRASWEESHR
jgi:hypothetical protein